MTCVYSEEHNNHLFSILDVSVQNALYPSISICHNFFVYFSSAYFHNFQILFYIGSMYHYHKLDISYWPYMEFNDLEQERENEEV